MGADRDDPVLFPVRGISQRLDNDDPNYQAGVPDIYIALALAYDSLAAPAMSIDASGIASPDYTAMQPRLALSWNEQENGDWIVRLRPGVRSQAGNELTAEDIAWVFRKAYAHETLSSWRWRQVVGVEKVEALDRYTVRYRLRSPYPTFPNWLLPVTPNIVDSTEIRAHATPEDPWGIQWLNSNVAGFGPYALAQMDADHLLFQARDDYWAGRSETARVEVGTAPDRASAIRLLDEKRPVVIVGLDPDEIAHLSKRDDLTLHRVWAGHVSIEVNFTRPPFDNPAVRHALAFATPYDRIIRDGLLGLARPWHSPAKGTSQWGSCGHRHYEENPAKARELLARAGFAQGLKADLHIDRRPDCQRMGEIIADAWRRVGVELTLKDAAGLPAGELPELLLRTDCAHNLSEPIYDIAHDYAAMSQILPAPGGPRGVGTWNPRWEKNDEAIGRFADLLLEPDAGRKRQRFDELQSYLVDFSSSIFLAEVQYATAQNSQVPRSFLTANTRPFHAFQYQNCISDFYLPLRHPTGSNG
ncbi:ABC transporter substrate-binding protein [Bosea sp. (in: a-proteobacteria)]|uniref:ABC transporter substrate-binding protein n=1 Tax=Bosea sp. (in: a-proteobacteria) TaxID=1871050 RepID=UPI0026321AAF|nr:ABC transporter substrate-binding protein [Bosea sp. (in: a-proteobacteria)]MCO5091215.1 ABC transporter substrate-binding protein [Bosea sp. (in: a-proteobacteria)]